MLLYLDDSIAQTLNKRAPFPSEVSAFENISSAFRAGSHLVCGNPSSLRTLKELTDLSSSARSSFNKIFSRLPQMKTIMEKVSIYVSIGFYEKEISAKEENGIKKINISIAKIDKINLRSPTEIIFEDISDQNIYEIISKWYVREKINNKYLYRKIRVLHGGGVRTSFNYEERQLAEESFCICVTDSDKKYPNDKCGQTSIDVRRLDDPLKPLSYHMDLDFHEIENLIPLSHLEIRSPSKDAKTIISYLKQAEKNGFPECKLFLDYKKGINLFSLKSNNDYFSYWTRAMSLSVPECNITCDQKSCKCFILKPWPSRKELKEDLQNKIDLSPNDCTTLSKLWDEIGSCLVSWSVATTPQLT